MDNLYVIDGITDTTFMVDENTYIKYKDLLKKFIDETEDILTNAKELRPLNNEHFYGVNPKDYRKITSAKDTRYLSNKEGKVPDHINNYINILKYFLEDMLDLQYKYYDTDDLIEAYREHMKYLEDKYQIEILDTPPKMDF